MRRDYSRRLSVAAWERGLRYIRDNPQVRDVLLSGGDPLTLSNCKLEWLLTELRRIDHVEIIRIGTKAPMVLPMRITRDLVRLLSRFHPLWMSIHVTHPDELTEETKMACGRLSDSGIPLGSQTVLLKGINDDAETLKTLFQKLLTFRVKPYYLYQCDPVTGTGHFRTPLERGIELMDALQGHTSGYAIPYFVVDAPGGGGKIPLFSNRMSNAKDGTVLLRNYEGKYFPYKETLCI
jgi:lysine 2,3-aminomutase